MNQLSKNEAFLFLFRDHNRKIMDRDWWGISDHKNTAREHFMNAHRVIKFNTETLEGTYVKDRHTGNVGRYVDSNTIEFIINCMDPTDLYPNTDDINFAEIREWDMAVAKLYGGIKRDEVVCLATDTGKTQITQHFGRAFRNAPQVETTYTRPVKQTLKVKLDDLK